MFNIGGSLGLAIAVVIYHWRSNAFLNHFFSQQNISTEELSLLQKTLDNPTGSMHVSMSDATHALFNSAFIHGFTSVMWFLFALSFVTLLSVLIWKLRENRI
jgi:hypothetical protein